jgi:tRNA (guanine37-N1)-methyltransferase
MNKIKGVSPMLGDAREMAKRLKEPDRIIMNLPHSAIDFLDTALEIAAPGATIHLYTIQEKDTLDIIRNGIVKLAESMGRKPEINNIQELHGYSPSQQMFCFDIHVN